jgi:hypothetical protein
MKEKTLNKRAIAINEKLRKLQQECLKLIDDIDEFASEDEYEFYFRYLKETLDELSSFDLEDSIEPERYEK